MVRPGPAAEVVEAIHEGTTLRVDSLSETGRPRPEISCERWGAEEKQRQGYPALWRC